MRSRRANEIGEQNRKMAKRAQRRQPHADKYADRKMQAKLLDLAAHFNGEGVDHE